jgi:hypothetical protein
MHAVTDSDDLRNELARRLLTHVYPIAIEMRAREQHAAGVPDWKGFLANHPELAAERHAVIAELSGFGLDIEPVIAAVLKSLEPPA